MLDWDKLRIFHTAAESGSFTHAAEKLNMSQSAVSRQISALEEDLVSPLGVDLDGRLVCLGAAREEETALLAGHLRDQRLQPLHRRIVAQDVVAQGRLEHGPLHGRRRAGHGVAPQVVHGLHGA